MSVGNGTRTMCLGIPMEIVEVNGTVARCRARGVERDVSLFLVQDQNPQPGDWVVVHVGYAIQRVDPAAGRAATTLLEEALSGGGNIPHA